MSVAKKVAVALSAVLLSLSIASCGGSGNAGSTETGNHIVESTEGYKRVVVEDMSFEVPENLPEFDAIDMGDNAVSYLAMNDKFSISVDIDHGREFKTDREGTQLAKVGDYNVYVTPANDEPDEDGDYYSYIVLNRDGTGHDIYFFGDDKAAIDEAHQHAFESLIID